MLTNFDDCDSEKTCIILDIDGTIADCVGETSIYDFSNVIPDENMIRAINILYDKGHRIIILTGRGSFTGIDWKEITEKQLESWGLKYHELRFIKKPLKYLYVDDCACSPEEFWHRIDL